MISTSKTYLEPIPIAGMSVLAMALAVTACSAVPIRDPAYASVRPQPLPTVQENPGAIYQHGQAIALYENYRARRVGDILTIRLTENTNATKKAATDTKKETSVEVPNPTLLGTTAQYSLPGIIPLASNRNNSLEVGIDTTQEFTGEGSSSQSNALTGNITVTVVEVLTNGNLAVRGEKILSLGQGDEHIRISGIVRAGDIQYDNSVMSTQLADAVIVYGGSGVTDDANRMGWLARFFNSKWWPF
jgi:flagellar L-ring protein FlgH